MSRVTNEVLANKIDNLHDEVRDMKTDIKANTEFRLKSKGVIGAIAFISTMVGGVILWVVTKLSGKQ